MIKSINNIFISTCFFITTINAHVPENLPIYGSPSGENPLWTILICTLEERAEKFNYIYSKLLHQIHQLNLGAEIEILFFRDNREYTVGYKRNMLLERSRGKYVCFIDDDDDVHTKYIEIIYRALQTNPDCVSLTGIMTTNGKKPQKFIHSVRYHSYFFRNGVFYRPPNHLNPIRRSIAILYKFPETSMGEDTAWAMQIVQGRLIKTEYAIKIPYYFYNFVHKGNPV